jgi:dihydrolipoamide dehydrogenase
LLRSLAALGEAKDAASFGVIGVDTKKAVLDMKKVQARKKGIVDGLVGGVTGLMGKNKIKVLEGEAKIADAKTVVVSGKNYSTGSIIIATGSEVKSLPQEIITKKDVLTSDELLDLKEIPKEITIIGGGVIGVEFAYFLAGAGSKVTIVEFLPRILPPVDAEIADLVTKDLEGMGIKIFTDAKVAKIADKTVEFEKGGATEKVSAKSVLMAVGRAPHLSIDADALGIKTDRGAIVTDEYMRTSVPNIYAIGDVNAKVMLAHTASAEGIVAAKNIAGIETKMNYDVIPSAIYIKPEVASVGLSEEDAKEKFGDIKVGKFPVMANGKSKVEGDERGLIKVITDAKYGEILGVHLYCAHATDMIAEAVVAMTAEATAETIAETIHPHPTVSEGIMEAFHAVIGGAIHC